ncbi:MAG: glycosyltransferase family 92 protein, partial [Candidatus Omnitrophota bacterium]
MSEEVPVGGGDNGKFHENVLSVDENSFPDFDWETYVDNYFDLQRMGIDSEQKAMRHWLDHGKKEGRTYIRPFKNKQDTNVCEKRDYKWNISVFSIFQNDAPFLKEWIEFHKLIGVEHFFLYNNLSTDNYEVVLGPYIESGEVDLIDWPFNPLFKGGSAEDHMRSWINLQVEAMTDCFIHRAKQATRWFGCLDTDEFLFPVQCYSLKEFLEDFKWSAGIVVNWAMYDSSHVERLKDNELLIEKLLYRAPDDFSYHSVMKSIVRTAVTRGPGDPHQFQYHKGWLPVTVDKKQHFGDRLAAVQYDKLRIN